MEITELESGLFNLEEFIDFPINVVSKYFRDKGWKQFDCFNDYKYAWIKTNINKSIVAKVNMTDDETKGFLIVSDIWWYEGIYSE